MFLFTCKLILGTLVATTATLPAATKPPLITAQDLFRSNYGYDPVTIRGTVRNLVADDIDPRHTYIVLTCDGNVVYAPIEIAPTFRTENQSLIGSKVELTGVIIDSFNYNRGRIGHQLGLASTNAIKVIRSATQSFDELPDIRALWKIPPADVALLDRHCVKGTVLAQWDERFFLLSTASNELVRVELAQPSAPAAGCCVAVAGFPESNLYDLTLHHAQWHPLNDPAPVHDTAVTNVTIRDFVGQSRQHKFFYLSLHGHTVRIVGNVLKTPSDRNDSLLLDCEGVILPVNLSNCDERLRSLTAGSRIEVTGVAIREIEPWSPGNAFPRIKGFLLVPRTTADVRLLRAPSWWTSGRLLTALAVLCAITLVFLAWNVILKRQVERRSRALVKEELAAALSDLKAEERTRLAVELHDSLAQDLGGVAMEIKTAAAFDRDAHDEMAKHVKIADRALESCTTELRQCLWDLRSSALDETDLNKAILRTLQPYIHGAKVIVRCNVQRSVLPDHTAYAMLRIIRELVINAIRHGQASKVRIAGCSENDTLLFSITDNGCGFDPDAAPGVQQGHYGLQGVRERTRQMGGTVEIRSKIGIGTKVSVALKIQEQQ